MAAWPQTKLWPVAPAPERAGIGQPSRAGKTLQTRFLCRPIPGPATGNMEHGTSMLTIPVKCTGMQSTKYGILAHDWDPRTGSRQVRLGSTLQLPEAQPSRCECQQTHSARAVARDASAAWATSSGPVGVAQPPEKLSGGAPGP